MMAVQGIMERSGVVNFLTGLWMMSCFVAGAREGPSVAAMFVFGDSLADAGNNNYIPHCLSRANFTPYGVSFFPYPTGRFTNGRTTFDFLATYLGLPFPPPFLKPKKDSRQGINFASGGSGLLDSTGAESHIITLSRQVFQFEHFSYILRKTHPYGAKQAKSYLGDSLYCITIGGNDVADYFSNVTLRVTYTPEQFVNLLLAKFNQYMARLYRGGARKFLVLGIPSVGCTPYIRYLAYSLTNGECLDIANQLAVACNTALKSLVDHLNEKLDGVAIIKFNSYDFFMNIIQNSEAYGFTDTKSACCGSGMFNAEVGCGRTNPQGLFCKDTSSHVFWDRIHPTEKVYAMSSHQIWTGNSSVMYPFNLSKLVSQTNA